VPIWASSPEGPEKYVHEVARTTTRSREINQWTLLFLTSPPIRILASSMRD
jgi:hypothetical protein